MCVYIYYPILSPAHDPGWKAIGQMGQSKKKDDSPVDLGVYPDETDYHYIISLIIPSWLIVNLLSLLENSAWSDHHHTKMIVKSPSDTIIESKITIIDGQITRHG